MTSVLSDVQSPERVEIYDDGHRVRRRRENRACRKQMVQQIKDCEGGSGNKQDALIFPQP